MNKYVLSIVSEMMSDLQLEYGFGSYAKDPVVYPYFVGEYQEVEPSTEDGLQTATLILTGFTRGSWLDLENAKQKISDYLTYEGTSFKEPDGSYAVLSYSNAFIVPKEEMDLKSIQINVNIQEWKVI